MTKEVLGNENGITNNSISFTVFGNFTNKNPNIVYTKIRYSCVCNIGLKLIKATIMIL